MARRVYNKVYDPEVWEQVNPRNKELLDDFVLDLRENKMNSLTFNPSLNVAIERSTS